MQMDNDTLCFVADGSPVERGLLNFLNSMQISVHDRMIERESPHRYELKAWIPFTSERKIMTVAYIDK